MLRDIQLLSYRFRRGTYDNGIPMPTCTMMVGLVIDTLWLIHEIPHGLSNLLVYGGILLDELLDEPDPARGADSAASIRASSGIRQVLFHKA